MVSRWGSRSVSNAYSRTIGEWVCRESSSDGKGNQIRSHYVHKELDYGDIAFRSACKIGKVRWLHHDHEWYEPEK